MKLVLWRSFNNVNHTTVARPRDNNDNNKQTTHINVGLGR